MCNHNHDKRGRNRNIHFYFTKDLSVSMSNNETLQIIYQGKPIFIMSSDVNSPNYGNAVGAVGDVDLAFAELQSQMRKK